MKYFKSFLILAVALFLFSACQKESEATLSEDVVSSFSFVSSKPELSSETRTAWTGNGINWSKNDAIKMAYTVNDVWQNANGDATVNENNKSDAKIYQSTPLTDDCVKAEFTVSGSFKGTTSGNYKFYSVYPSAAVSNTTFEYAPSMTVVLPTTQTPLEDSFDSSADLMIGSSVEEYTSRPSEAIPLMWTRLVAHGYFTLKGFQGVEEDEVIKSISFTAQDEANLVGTEYVSIVDGTYRKSNSSSNVTNTLYINGTNLSFITEDGNKNIKVWLSVMPETLTSLTVVVETNKATYTRPISGISIALKANSRNLLTINMSSAERESTTIPVQLFDNGNYLFSITHSQGGDKMMSASISSPQQAVVTSTVVNDGVYEADKAAVWTVTYNETDGTYSILSVDKEKYLNGGVGATDLKADSDDPVYFSAEEVVDGVYTFSIKEGSNIRYLSYNYNNGSDRFGMYNSEGDSYVKNITLLPAVAKEEQQIIETPKAGTDVINYSFTGISGTSYADWGPKLGSATNAYYKGNSGGANSSVQLRSNNNNSGIITWKSSGYVKSITVTWNSNTTDGRTLDIYGKNTAYEETTDLYNADKQGTKVGSIVKGSSTTYTFDKNYKYVGIRSSNSAMYLDNISIEWGTEAIQETVATPVISLANNVVSITTATENASIYYTIDGSTPSAASTPYTGGISLTEGDSFTIKAIAIKEGYNNSTVAEQGVAYYTPGDNQSFTITDSDFGNSYATNTFTKNNNSVTISYSDVANYGNGIQFKASTGNLYNTVSLGTIKRITIVEKEGKKHTNLKVYAGNSAESITTEITANGLVYDFSAGSYSFFKFSNGSYAAYLSSITVEYN